MFIKERILLCVQRYEILRMRQLKEYYKKISKYSNILFLKNESTYLSFLIYDQIEDVVFITYKIYSHLNFALFKLDTKD